MTCTPRLQDVLSVELKALGYPARPIGDKALLTKGGFSDVMKLNLFLRTANRVLWTVDDFNVVHPRQLYKKIRSIKWEDWFDSDGYFTVASSVSNKFIRDTRYANLVVKDAIADRFVQRLGKRPDSGPEKLGAGVYMHWHDTRCTVYMDTTGESLSRRGYRKNPWKAPLQETLAAAIVMSSRWDRTVPLVHPMCGSGTLAIEAALIARNMPAGIQRQDFGFMHLRGYEAARWSALKQSAMKDYMPVGPRIMATDRDRAAVDAARSNAQKAGVDDVIEFSVCDFRRTEIPGSEGVIVFNPGYGERIGSEEKLERLYGEIGDFLKSACAGYTGYIFTGNLQLAKHVGLRTSRRIPFYNGRIDCRLLEYELYEGSKKERSG